ncbi:cysteine dioxygenase [Paenibacillus ihumii]|uniref:cysteine dioxygenase n=1 Tax=Paenibacillus ihumii TaxID=687436 RepID=UPI0006D76CF7|nr:cysteine dioxygenase family protein [Paenibacillus ihumii]
MPTNVKPAVTSNIQKLIHLLLNSPSFEDSCEMIRTAEISERDVEPYRHFHASSYGRNLVFTCEKFEIILMCWREGQESAIHDHSQSDCILRCISGRFEELVYTLEPSNKLRHVQSRIIEAGDISYINNDLGLHKIRNSVHGVSLALHFYFPGISQFQVFDEAEENDPKVVHSTFTSRFGRL